MLGPERTRDTPRSPAMSGWPWDFTRHHPATSHKHELFLRGDLLSPPRCARTCRVNRVPAAAQQGAGHRQSKSRVPEISELPRSWGGGTEAARAAVSQGEVGAASGDEDSLCPGLGGPSPQGSPYHVSRATTPGRTEPPSQHLGAM